MADTINFQRQPVAKSNLEDLMVVDPFYQSGMIDLKNVRSFEEDPRLQYQAAPLFTGVNPTAVAQEKASKYGYTYPEDPLMYIESLNNPTMETAATTTHEGIHKVLPEGFLDLVAQDAGSALGPSDYSYNYNSPGWQDYAYLSADHARNELMTRYLENQIYGDEIAPFDESMGEMDPYGKGSFNYITMDRPGQGPLGLTGLKKILAKRGMPFLKKVAKRAHQNIESRYKPPIKPPTNVPGTPIVPTGGSGVSNINIQKQKIGMPEHLTTYTSPSAPTGTGGPPSIISRPAPSAPIRTGGPPSRGGRGGGPPSQGGGSSRGGGGQRGRNPWGRADGGLIDFYRYGGFVG
tara:strand:- start:26 stop:1069 length:1044 start_codon:yes stop_codon:yes gene_type:complete